MKWYAELTFLVEPTMHATARPEDKHQLVTWFRSWRPLFELAQSRLSITHGTTLHHSTRLPKLDHFVSSTNIASSGTINRHESKGYGTSKTSRGGRRPLHFASALEAKSPNCHFKFVQLPVILSSCIERMR